MTIQIIGAMLAAFCITRVFGKRLIPWLEKHGFRCCSYAEIAK